MTSMEVYKNKQWYDDLKEEAKYIFELIDKYHQYFSAQDKKYQKVVRILKVLILILAMLSTIILGIKSTGIFTIERQMLFGLIFSTLITFVTAISSYFNFEEYWMRNITIHIELNVVRDNFIYDTKADKLDEERLEYYKKKLDDIQYNNIKYWQKAIKKI